MRTRRLTLLSIVLALALAAVTPGVAQAHARLVRATPEDGAVLSAAPREVRLWFDEPVAAAFSSAQLLDADGRPLGAIALRADPADARLLIGELPPAAAGLYSLTWRVFSAIDSHTSQGTLVFGVNRSVDPAVRAAAVEPAPPLAEVALRAALYAALAALIGGWLAAGLILRPRAFEPALGALAQAARVRALRVGLVGAGGALAVGLASLAWQAATLSSGSLTELLRARYGALWLAQQGLLAVSFLALVGAGRGQRWGWLSGGVSLALLVWPPALSSHAAGLEEAGGLAVAVQALHLLAAGAWLGTLAALAVAVWPALRSGAERPRALALAGWQRFGALAGLSVGTLAATGLYNAARQVASLDAWTGTPYGAALGLKLALFAAAGLAGLLNAARLHPWLAALAPRRLRRAADPARLPLGVLGELMLGLAIFSLTGWLTATPPARGPEFSAPASRPPSTLTLSAADLVINLQIRPNKPGANLITVGVLNTRRPPPAEVARVLVRLTYQGQTLGTQTLSAEPGETAGEYRINTNTLSLAGAWQAQVVVRRRGLPDAVAVFAWQVEPLIVRRPTQISNAPLAPALTALAAGLAALTGLAGLAGWRGRWFSRARPPAEAPQTGGWEAG